MINKGTYKHINEIPGNPSEYEMQKKKKLRIVERLISLAGYYQWLRTKFIIGRRLTANFREMYTMQGDTSLKALQLRNWSLDWKRTCSDLKYYESTINEKMLRKKL